MERLAKPADESENGNSFNPLLHIHIPKTAGTSIRNSLVQTFSPETVFYYNHGTGNFVRSSQRGLSGSEKPLVDIFKSLAYRSGHFSLVRPLFKRAAERERRHQIAPEDFFGTTSTATCQAISGHFNADQAESWGVAHNLGLSIVREPLARFISHYHHYVRVQGKLGSLASMPTQQSSELMSLDEFIELPVYTNIQTRYLGQLPNIAVGTIEASGQLFEELGLPNTAPKHLNRTPNADTVHIGSTAIARFIERNAADYELFYKAQNRWQ